MSPLFSIIVPVYRSGPFLRDCLDSIRNQTLTDWECICINDGSRTTAEPFWTNTPGRTPVSPPSTRKTGA